MPLINEKNTLALCLILSLAHATSLQAAEDTSASIVKFQQTMATKGHATAQYKLAMLYETGDGVEQDLETARIWYGRAASQSYTPATHRMKYLDITQTGTSADKTWLKQLHRDAQAGDGEAMFLLGQMYARGTGITQELTLASRYLRKARAENIPGSEAELTQVDMAIKQRQAEALATEKRQAAVTARQTQQKADAKLAEQQRRQQILLQKKLADAQQFRQQQSLVKQPRLTPAQPVTQPVTRELANREMTLPQTTASAVTEMDLSPCSGRNRFTSTCR